ncbi:MAG: LptE family protein [Candidatus Aminicenantes bacterium]|nr:LptE family protein [Candidatus Aminicenantes bacterium]
MDKRTKKRLFCSGFLSLCLICCGYHLRGTGSFLPSHINKIYVPMFKNNTTRYQLDLKLTQSVIDEVVARGNVESIGDIQSADAVLTGEIVAFQATPIGYSGEATADRYKITIITKITLRDMVNNRIIFSNPYFPYQTEYEVPEGTDFESVEMEAIDNIAVKYARSLIITILEGF